MSQMFRDGTHPDLHTIVLFRIFDIATAEPPPVTFYFDQITLRSTDQSFGLSLPNTIITSTFAIPQAATYGLDTIAVTLRTAGTTGVHMIARAADDTWPDGSDVEHDLSYDNGGVVTKCNRSPFKLLFQPILDADFINRYRGTNGVALPNVP